MHCSHHKDLLSNKTSLLTCGPVYSCGIYWKCVLDGEKPREAPLQAENLAAWPAVTGRNQNGLVFDPPRWALHLNGHESSSKSAVLLFILLELIPATLTRVFAPRFQRVGFCYIGFAVAFECDAHFPHLKQSTFMHNAIVELARLHG
jgi:hypothetical protein